MINASGRGEACSSNGLGSVDGSQDIGQIQPKTSPADSTTTAIQMGGPSDSCSGTGKRPQKPSPAATTTAIHYLLLLLLPLLLITRVPASRLIATRASRIPCDDEFQ
nr:hypothetical protein CFP56_64518 [Quercus suber]